MNEEFDDKLMKDAARLATEIAPERDLWPQIAATIATPRRSRFTVYFAQAAVIALLIGATSFITYEVTKTDYSDTTASTSPETMLSPSLTLNPASFGGDYELSSEFKLARSNLQADLKVELQRLSPESRAVVERNLRLIRGAIAQINDALEKEPDNVHLQELLIKTYREELAVMQKVGGLTQNVMMRNDI
jgi:hypothetical protein